MMFTLNPSLELTEKSGKKQRCERWPRTKVSIGPSKNIMKYLKNMDFHAGCMVVFTPTVGSEVAIRDIKEGEVVVEERPCLGKWCHLRCEEHLIFGKLF